MHTRTSCWIAANQQLVLKKQMVVFQGSQRGTATLHRWPVDGVIAEVAKRHSRLHCHCEDQVDLVEGAQDVGILIP